jgi:hypothetical protein
LYGCTGCAQVARKFKARIIQVDNQSPAGARQQCGLQREQTETASMSAGCANVMASGSEYAIRARTVTYSANAPMRQKSRVETQMTSR